MGGDANGPDVPAPDYFVVGDRYGNDVDVDSDGNELDPDGPLGNRLYDTDRDSVISLTGSSNSTDEDDVKSKTKKQGPSKNGNNNTGNGTSNDRKNDKTGSDRNSDDSGESHRKKQRRHKRHKGKKHKSHKDQSSSSSEEEEQSSSNDQPSRRKHKRRHKHRNNIASELLTLEGLWSGQMLALYTSQNGIPVSQAFPFFTWRIKPAKDQGSFRGSFRYPTMPQTQKGRITGDMLDGAQFMLQSKDDFSTITFTGSLFISPMTGEAFVSGNWTRYWRGQDMDPYHNDGSFTGKLGGPRPPSDYREPGSIVVR